MSKVGSYFADAISRSLRKVVLAFTLISMLLASASAEKRLTPQEEAVLMPLQKVLEGIAKHDRDEVQRQLLPGGSATLMRDGKPVQLSFDAFVERIPESTEQLEERIHDPQIRIDDNIAIIWAPYEFFIHGVIDHRGTDVVYLIREDGQWLIAAIGDNSRKVGRNRPANH